MYTIHIRHLSSAGGEYATQRLHQVLKYHIVINDKYMEPFYHAIYRLFLCPNTFTESLCKQAIVSFSFLVPGARYPNPPPSPRCMPSLDIIHSIIQLHCPHTRRGSS